MSDNTRAVIQCSVDASNRGAMHRGDVIAQRLIELATPEQGTQ
ncbi:MAG: hypothetical protein ACEQSK_06135 [Sphingomonadaceae bacterium]